MNISEIEQYIKDHSMKEILLHCNELFENNDESSIDELVGFLSVRHSIWERYETIRYITRLLLSLGKPGIKALETLLREKRWEVREAAILEVVFATSKGEEYSLGELDNELWILHPTLDSEISQLARDALTRYVNEALQNPELCFDLIQFIYQSTLMSLTNKEIDSTLFRIISKSINKINESCLENYEILILSQYREERYQKFLEENPCLIDPLANKVFNKHNLGDDLKTDFVVKRLDDQYLLVEIEKPVTPIFTSKDDFSAKFTHAFGQILDFQEWIESNIAYAQQKLPGIHSPAGLLIIGMRSQLSHSQKKKLNRFNVTTRGRVNIITFDDLLDTGRRYLNNLFG